MIRPIPVLLCQCVSKAGKTHDEHMKIKNFKARQFRNLKNLQMECFAGLNILLGNNGQGKTNIIEGIYILSALSSFRHCTAAQFIQFGQTEALLGSDIYEGHHLKDLEIRWGIGRRTNSINGKLTSASRYIGELKTVVFSPESLMAIKSGPELRRDLVDRAALQSDTKAAAIQWNFNKALKQRNALLKQIKNGQLSIQKARGLLESFDLVYIEAAAQLTFQRREFLKAIEPLMQSPLRQILGDQNARLTFEYEDSEGSWFEATSIDIMKQRVLLAIDDPLRRQSEERIGTTLTGPHRHDIRFVFNGNDSRIYASQGQQRALILSFKMAEIVYHEKTFGSYPILLLDDVLSELDEMKRNFLIEFLRTNEAQTFVATTDLASAQLLKRGRCSIFSVDQGQITPMES